LRVTGFSGFPAKTLFSPLRSSLPKHRAGRPDSPLCRAGAQGSTRTRVRARKALFVFYLHASPEEDKCLMNSVLGVKRRMYSSFTGEEVGKDKAFTHKSQNVKRIGGGVKAKNGK